MSGRRIGTAALGKRRGLAESPDFIMSPSSLLAFRRVFSAALVLSVAFALTGCGTVGEDFNAGLREKVRGPDFATTLVPGTQATVFAAAVATAEELGFRVTRSRAAAGIVEGLSRLASDDALAGSRQRAIYVQLEERLDGVEVRVRFTEIVEDDFAKGGGRATEATLRDTPLIQVFQRRVAERVAAAEAAELAPTADALNSK